MTTNAAEVRLEWGRHGAEEAAARGDWTIVVDVLSFATAVSVAVGRGAAVVPCASRAEAEQRARADGGLACAVARDEVPARGRWSLSPACYEEAGPGDRIALWSPNGATCARLAERVPGLWAGCLRNAGATAAAVGRRRADDSARGVTIVACGERRPDGALRFALEDWLGAGAIAAGLAGPRSPEAEAARASYLEALVDLAGRVLSCPSGVELRDRGYADDVEAASRLDADRVVAAWRDGAFVAGG